MTHILFHRNNNWQSVVRDSTNIYAQHYLSAGYQITYMQGLTHIGRPKRFQMPYRDSGVNIFTPLSLLPIQKQGILSLPHIVNLQYRLCIPSIRTLVNFGGYGPPDVIWTTRVGSSSLRRIFPQSILVFQVVDYYPAFGGSHTKSAEQQDYLQADHIFTIGHALTKYLIDELNIQPEKITTLGQGVALDRYKDTSNEPADIRALPQPRAIWVGVLSKGDFELFTAAAQTLSELGGSLILIGPPCDWANNLAQRFSNVHVLGPRDPKTVPDYLLCCEIGLMLYSRVSSEIDRGQNPLKLYEYAAAKLIILSTPHEEYRFQKPPVLIVESPMDVVSALHTAVKNPTLWKRETAEFVADQSWENKFRISEAVVNRLLEQRSHISTKGT